MRLSIIVCVYNTDKEYLRACFASIRRELLEPESYEILMIDDGSAVDYSDIISEFGVRCEKTENRGIFLARLLGIELARGDYIAFVDSDDTVSVNYHRPMLERAEQSDADIVYNDWAFHTSGARYYCKRDETVSGDFSLSGDDILLMFMKHGGRQHAYYVLWNKLYRAELIKRVAELLLPIASGEERFNYSEDALMNFYLHRLARHAENLHTGYYFYRIHSSQSVGVTSSEKLSRQISNMAFTLRTMADGVGENIHREKILSHISEWSELMSRAHYSHALSGGYTELFSKIKEEYGVSELRRALPSDDDAYLGNGILPSNIEDIDIALAALFSGGEKIEVHAGSLGKYSRSVLEYMIKYGKEVRLLKKGGVRLPKERRSIKQIIVRSYPVAKLAAILFPKGSKIRAFLKKMV